MQARLKQEHTAVTRSYELDKICEKEDIRQFRPAVILYFHDGKFSAHRYCSELTGSDYSEWTPSTLETFKLAPYLLALVREYESEFAAAQAQKQTTNK